MGGGRCLVSLDIHNKAQSVPSRKKAMFIFRIIFVSIIRNKLKAYSQYMGGTRNHWKLKQACTPFRVPSERSDKDERSLVLCSNCVFFYIRSAMIWILRYSVVIWIRTCRGILLPPPASTFKRNKERSISFPWNIDTEHFFQTQGANLNLKSQVLLTRSR